MPLEPSRKGLYLVAMAVAAFLFIAYLFISPMFLIDTHPAPPLLFVGVLVAIAVIGFALWIWRASMKRKGPLPREDGQVSGQTEVLPKRP